MCNVFFLRTYYAKRNFCAISVLYLLDPAYHHLATNPSKHRDITYTVYFPPKTNTHRKNPVKPNILFQPIFLGFGGSFCEAVTSPVFQRCWPNGIDISTVGTNAPPSVIDQSCTRQRLMWPMAGVKASATASNQRPFWAFCGRFFNMSIC